eukprot:sb/3463722/
MVDVTVKNFHEVVTQFEENLENATFVCLDFEFSGLHTNRCPNVSLFDTPKERYHILKESCKDFSPLQCGLTVFTYDRTSRNYDSTSYNFALHPRLYKNLSQSVIYETAACHFLMSHDFDFNKSFYGGIPFLNEEEITNLQLISPDTPRVEEILLNDVKKAFRSRKHEFLKRWSDEARLQEKTVIDAFSKGMMEVLISDVMTSLDFPDIVAYQLPGENSTLEVMKVNPDGGKEEFNKQEIENKARELSDAIGFTHIVRLLRKTRTPIVGHNVLMDLLYLYHKFYKPLPECYEEFKRRFSREFPEVYDTRHIISNIKVALKNDEKYGNFFRSTSLLNLYEECNGPFVRGMEYQPRIQSNLSTEMGMKAHNAGYDSFLAGAVFVRLAHFSATVNNTSPYTKPFHYMDYRRELEGYRNHVNLIRCSLTHINLAGEDPVFGRPQWLVVSRVDKNPISPDHVSRVFSAFGDVSVREMDGGCLVALPSIGMSAGVLVEMEGHEVYRVTRYEPGSGGWTSRTGAVVVVVSVGCVVGLFLRRFLK